MEKLARGGAVDLEFRVGCKIKMIKEKRIKCDILANVPMNIASAAPFFPFR